MLRIRVFDWDFFSADDLIGPARQAALSLEAARISECLIPAPSFKWRRGCPAAGAARAAGAAWAAGAARAAGDARAPPRLALPAPL